MVILTLNFHQLTIVGHNIFRVQTLDYVPLQLFSLTDLNYVIERRNVHISIVFFIFIFFRLKYVIVAVCYAKTTITCLYSLQTPHRKTQLNKEPRSVPAEVKWIQKVFVEIKAYQGHFPVHSYFGCQDKTH